MILELVLFKPPSKDRETVLVDAKKTIPRWRGFPDLPRKHYLLSDDGWGGGVYIWPNREAAEKGHDMEWRAGIEKRTGAPPVIRYFDLLMVLDNEAGTVTEWSERGEPHAVLAETV